MKKSLLKLSLGIVATAFGLSSFAQTYTFTTCTATGMNGPTQGQVTTAYTSTTLQGNVTINTQGIQEWTVPATGPYTIEAIGAQGARSGGQGARMIGEFNLTGGEVIKIAVGQIGIDGSIVNTTYEGGGGGGGSFVIRAPYNTNGSVLVIAGGGGGLTNFGTPTTHDAVTTGDGGDTYQNGGGTAGSGGQMGIANGPAAGGGGFLTDGQDGTYGSPFAGGGKSFQNGLVGGVAGASNGRISGEGGFGGGAGGVNNSYDRSGGAGGYSGGQGGSWSGQESGGGGGSYNSGTNQSNTAAFSTGNGQVIITSLCNGGPAAAIAVFTQDSVCLNDMPMALPAGTPSGGTYSGTGVSGSNFDPAMAGVGTHYVVYSNTDSCSFTSMDSTMIVVKGLPTILLNPFSSDTVCVQDQPQALPTGNPSGGTYSGAGVSGSNFDPSIAGIGTHYVVYTAMGANNCSNSDSAMIVVESCVGINENVSLNNVSIYPNPTNGLVTIDLGTHNGTVNYSISTIEGRIVNSQQGVNANILTIDISNESKGIYLLKIEDATSAKTYKIIKE